MQDAEPGGLAEVFEPLRPRLVRLAYRMLGSLADAEDVVQEAFLRWVKADRDQLREPEAYLRRVTARLCLDHLKSARHRRETYVGTWLPEPVVEPAEDEVDDFTLPLMMALERLSPLERAAFLLHDVFGLDFEEVGETIGRRPAACRQLASRARAHVREAGKRFPLPRDQGMEIAEAFFAASRSGDLGTLQALLAESVTVFADGGGKVPAARQPISGIAEVMRFQAALAKLFAEKPSRVLRFGIINGLPGFITIEQDRFLQTTALEIDGSKVVAVYVVRNPEKLTRLEALVSGAVPHGLLS
jgi:RNA polymerase sigma-70 factor (ECF subfamily)